MDPYATHQEAIMFAADLLGSPSITGLEIGIGHYSTPLLHYLCKVGLTSIETDLQWFNSFKRFNCDHHKLIYTDRIDLVKTLSGIDEKFDLCFIDSIDGQSRMEALNILYDKAKIFVVHDMENYYVNKKACYPGQIDTLDRFRHHCPIPGACNRIITAVLSNSINFSDT
jgi:hypothetical protein